MAERQWYDAALHLLDRQIVDCNGRFVAKVDDLELAEGEDGRLRVVALLTGPGALGPRMRDRLGELVVAVWHRLHPAEDPGPGRIPFGDVTDIGSDIEIARPRESLGVEGLEDWARDTVVGRIPGARHDPEQ